MACSPWWEAAPRNTDVDNTLRRSVARSISVRRRRRSQPILFASLEEWTASMTQNEAEYLALPDASNSMLLRMQATAKRAKAASQAAAYSPAPTPTPTHQHSSPAPGMQHDLTVALGRRVGDLEATLANSLARIADLEAELRATPLCCVHAAKCSRYCTHVHPVNCSCLFRN